MIMPSSSRLLLLNHCAYVNCHITLALACGATPYKNFMGDEGVYWIGGENKKIGGQGVEP